MKGEKFNMLHKDYEIDKIREKLNSELSENNALLDAWEKVSYQTKKDGTPFKTMSKNIVGATYKPTIYNHVGEYELTVSTGYPRYCHDSIDCYKSTYYLSSDDKCFDKPENFTDDYTYTYDLEDIKEAVNERIEYRKERKAELESALENLERAYNTYADMCLAAKKKLVEIAGKGTSLYYSVSESVNDSIRLM